MKTSLCHLLLLQPRAMRRYPSQRIRRLLGRVTTTMDSRCERRLLKME
jgi:hypothetical protein